MAHYGFFYDQSRCIGCNACQMACKDIHNLERGMVFRRAQTIEYEERGSFQVFHYSGACNHCSHAACVEACPEHAMYYQEDGTVGHDASRCIGCGSCTWACPYGAPKLSSRSGVAMKCDSCMERRKEGKEPACVEACLTHCLKFMDLDQLPERKKKDCVRDLPFLPDSSQTEPNLLIRRKGGCHHA